MCYKVLIWTVNDVINFKIYLQSTSKVMAGMGKERKMKIQKPEYLKNEKSFLYDIKKDIFHSF